jgi:hypothetical protein
MTGSGSVLLRETYGAAWAQRCEDLTPSVPYILIHILATTYDGDLIRQIPTACTEPESRWDLGARRGGPARDQLPLRGR